MPQAVSARISSRKKEGKGSFQPGLEKEYVLLDESCPPASKTAALEARPLIPILPGTPTLRICGRFYKGQYTGSKLRV